LRSGLAQRVRAAGLRSGFVQRARAAGLRSGFVRQVHAAALSLFVPLWSIFDGFVLSKTVSNTTSKCQRLKLLKF